MAGHTHLAAVPSRHSCRTSVDSLLNQSNFPTATPTLKLLLARDRVIDVAKGLKPYNAVQMIPFCKSLYFPVPMLV
jgi:hypothetical protein